MSEATGTDKTGATVAGQESQENQEGQESRIRWLVVGPFGVKRPTLVTSDKLAELMAASATMSLSLPDPLGGTAPRQVDLRLAKFSDFKMTEVQNAVPALKALRALAQEAGTLPGPELLARVKAAVGEGPLVDALAAQLDGGVAAAPKAPDSTEEFPLAPARSPVGAFVDALRGQTSASAPRVSPAARLRTALETAAFEGARAILTSPPVAERESTWRSLKLVLERVGRARDVVVEILDPQGADVFAELDGLLGERAPFDRPDAVFLLATEDEPERLLRFANLGADYQVPIVVGTTPRLLGMDDIHIVAIEAEREDRAVPPAWAELRKDPAAPWLTVALNRLVLVVDGAGTMARVSWGSPAMAVAAILTDSYIATGGFGRIVGSPGALAAGGTHEVTLGRQEPMAVPTETFLSIRAQTRLAALGVLGLGSGRNTDKIQLSLAPTATADATAVPLGAQVITGRIVRLASWIRDNVPKDSGGDVVATIFQQAGEVFLFTDPKVGALTAQLETTPEGQRIAVIQARAGHQLCGTVLQIAFGMPLP